MQVFQRETSRNHGKSEEFCAYQGILDKFLTPLWAAIETSLAYVAARAAAVPSATTLAIPP